MTFRQTLRDIANWWRRRCQRKRLERAYPALAELNRRIDEAKKRHEPVVSLYAARQRFIHRELSR